MQDKKNNLTTINEYFSYLESTVDENTSLYRTAHEYMENERRAVANKPKDRPFLSVITRTQGKRPAMLTETLLTMASQRNTDYEILLMGHNLSNEQRKSVNAMVEGLPAWQREKTRLIEVKGGTRTTPLNRGFDEARGEYIAILDDDDIVFDNWVETFADMAKETPGRVLHTYALYQDWQTINVGGTDCPRAIATPEKVFCQDYILGEQILINCCPPVSLAFPAYAFHEWCIRFDESLTTTEDWDYLMRTAFLTGVNNRKTVTSLYRNWVNAENSKTLHSSQEWYANHRTITQNFAKTPIVFPAEEIDRIISARLDTPLNASLDATPLSEEIELFLNMGCGFSAENKVEALRLDIDDPEVKNGYTFRFDLDHPELCRAIRFDPLNRGGFVVEDARVKVVTEDGAEKEFTTSDFRSNGIYHHKKWVFFSSDPQLILNLPKPMLITRVYCEFDMNYTIMQDTVDAIVKPKRHFIRRIVRKSKYILKKILRK